MPIGERWLAAVPVLVAVTMAIASRLGPFAGGLVPAWIWPRVPMAPLTSDGIWLLGVALIVLNWRHRLPAWRVIAAGTAGLLVVGQVVLGVHARSVVSVSLGLMAAVVLLMALTPERRSRLNAGGLVMALFLLTGHGIILLGHHFSVPLVQDPQLAPAAWTTILALVLLSFALVISCGATAWFVRDILGEATDDKRLVPLLVKRQRRLALLVLVLVFSVVATGGYLYLRSAIQQRRAILGAELTQVADLKTAQIEAWLRERKADAITLAQAPFLDGERAGVGRYLDGFRRAYDYREITVLDRTWAPVAVAPAGVPDVPPAGLIEQAMQAPEILIEDLAQGPDGTAGMGFIAPRRTPDGTFAGAVRLRVDAAVHLFPIIQSWPVKSETAESLMIRREGLTVLALSNLRFRADTALRLRYPLGQRDLPAAVAALDRRVELSEGVDYRGAPALWLSRPIAGTPWVLVVKVDQVEAYAALRADTWRVAGGFAVGLLAIGLLIGNYWRSRQRYYERQHIETEEERRLAVERLALVLKHAQDVILLFDEDMRVVEANDRTLAVYGRTPQEMRQLTAPDLRAEPAREATARDFAQVRSAEGITFETMHRRRDGTAFPVEVSAAAVEIEGRRHVLSIVRDITERKRLMAEVARQEARFRFVFDHMPVGISLSSPAGIELVNPAHALITGVPLAASRDHGVFARATLPEDYARQRVAAEQFIKGLADHYTVEKRYRHPDGKLQWAELTSRMFTDPVTGEQKIVTTLIDLAERKAHEQEIERLNRMYFVISQVNQALVRTHDRDELFREVCRVLAEVGRFRLAWAGWLNGETKVIEPIAAAGEAKDYISDIRISADGTLPEGLGPAGTSVREGRTYVCNDFFADPVTAPWRDRAAQSGLRSIISLPLRSEGRVCGLLAVYADEVGFFAAQEVTLLEETAGDMSYALDVFAGEARRRTAEEQLRQSQARLSYLVEATPAVIYTFNAIGDPRVTFISANVTKLAGWESGAFCDDANFWWEHVHPDDRAAAVAALARLQGEDSVVREFRFQHRDGSWRWTLDEVRLVRDPEGRPVEYIGSWIDISDRKAIEENLKRQEAQFRFIFERAPVGISLVLESGEVMVNETHARISGVPVKDSNIPGIFGKASHPEDYARQLVAAEPFARNEVDQYTFEKRYLHADGSTVWARLTSHWFINAATRQRQVLTIVSDITEQKRVETELRQQSAKFQFIYDHLPVGVSLWTKAHGLELNPAYIRISGVTAAEANRPGVFTRATHPEDHARQREITERFDRGEIDQISLEKRYLHPDGTVVWVEFTSHRFTEPVTGEQQTLTTVTDITARKRAVEALQAREEIFSNIVNQAMDAMALLDPGTARFIEFNRAAHEGLGYTREEFAALGIGGIQADHSLAEIGENVRRIMTEGGATFETRHRHRQGGPRDVRVSARKFTLRGQDCIAAVWTDITEAKRLTRELQASEALHRTLFENMDLGVVYHDAAGAIATANPAACRILGLTLDQMRGRDPFDPRWHAVREDGAHFPGEEHPGMVAMRTGQRVQDVVMGIRTGDDAPVRWLLVHAVPEFHAGETRPFRAFSIFADITERRQTQLALETSEAKFRRLLQMVPLPLGHADKDGRITFTNERFQRLIGYMPNEVPNVETWWQRVYPDPQYREALAAIWERSLRQAMAGNGEIAPLETNITRKDGQVRIVEISGMVLAGETLVAFVDITERVKTERKLRQQSRIIEQAPMSIAITDLTGAIEYVNPRFCEVTGYTLEEVLDQNPRVLKSGRTAPEVYVQMWQTLSRGEVWRGELCNKKKNGDLYYEQAVIAPVTDENGAITHYVALKEDITERKHRDEALRETQERYRLIAENTSDTIWLYDLATERFTYCSPSVVKLRGYPVEEVLTQKMADSLTPASAAHIATIMPERLARFAAGDHSVRTEVHELDQVHRDGHIIATEVSITILAGATGQPEQILGVTRDITERRRGEKELKESRDRLIQAEQIARLGNWSLELATGQVTWSDEMYRLLELDPATTTPSIELYHSFLPPEDRDLLQRRFTEAMGTRQRFVLGTRLILRSGRLKYAEGTGEVIVDAAGRPIRAIGTVQDVTERRLIEIELHELVKGLRVLRAISQALEQRTLDRTALLALVVRELPAAMTYPGDARAEIVIDGQRQEAGAEGTPLARLTAPISINDRVAGEVAVGYVRPHAGDDGPFRVREREVLESIARTIGLGLGEREAFAAVRQFNAELESKVAARTAELAARNRQIQSLFNTIPDTVMRVSADGIVLFSQRAPESPRLAAITPLPDTAASYRATADLLAACRELGRRALAENGTVSGDIEVATPGGPVAVELRAAPTGTEEFVVFARDISARKRLEAEVTAMLAKEREISEMKTRFISVTSHEFRTPMAAALGSVELLHNHFARMTPEKREELFTRIYGSLHRMTDMLDDILLLNRMDANRVEVRPTVVDLRKFIHSAVDEIRLGDREHHRFALEVADDLAEFVTDPSLLHHILSNLLSNAVRYSPADTTVTTRVTATATAVTITVEDQGIGIPEADRQRVFEAFERGSNVGQIKGTGLGLNIVKRMVGLLGGSISLASVPGGGSCFQFILPRSALPPTDS